jgi:hypothetical protein
MIMLMVIGSLVGAVLGVRFKVFVLVPVICAALAIVVVDGIARGDGLWRLSVAMVVVVTSGQLGYIGAIALRFVTGTPRAANHGRISLPTSAGMSESV